MLAKIKEVDKNAKTGPRVDYVSKDEELRLKREGNRIKALKEWELLNPHTVEATAGDVYQPMAGPIVAHLPAIGDTRVYAYK